MSTPPQTSRVLYFDHAATTRCNDRVAECLRRFASEDYGNPSSTHALGQAPARAIREARRFFADVFNVAPRQIIFTGSGSEANNLAICGGVMPRIAAQAKRASEGQAPASSPLRVITSAIEHPAALNAARSLRCFGVDVRTAPVLPDGQIDEAQFLDQVTPETALISLMSVNNIVGTELPVEALAAAAKRKAPDAIFHTDAIQAFGKTRVPAAPSAVDLVSISAHKVQGPKGVGALVILNERLLQQECPRPLIWGGGQEGGMRSGTENAGLISGFHLAAREALDERASRQARVEALNRELETLLRETGLTASGEVLWNSPRAGRVPQIVSLSVPGLPSGPIARLLEERGCLVSTGSACSSGKSTPDPVLTALGLPAEHAAAALRVSLSHDHSSADLQTLVRALADSIAQSRRLLGKSHSRAPTPSHEVKRPAVCTTPER